jgi:small subunit ribosomal protein S9
MAEMRYYATGKRKTAIARVWLSPGSGRITVNGLPFGEYFDVETARMIVERPLVLTGTLGQYDIQSSIRGGGKSTQSEAMRHGVARALLAVNDDFRVVLKKAGLLTRDARAKERKKYGLAGARKRYQYSKR